MLIDVKACEENGLMGPYGPLCFRYERKKNVSTFSLFSFGVLLPILTLKRTGWSEIADMNNGHPKLKTEGIKLKTSTKLLN